MVPRVGAGGVLSSKRLVLHINTRQTGKLFEAARILGDGGERDVPLCTLGVDQVAHQIVVVTRILIAQTRVKQLDVALVNSAILPGAVLSDPQTDSQFEQSVRVVCHYV